MRLLSTFVARHRLLGQELADNKSKKGKLLGDFSSFNVKETTALSGSDVNDINYQDSAVRAELYRVIKPLVI